MHFIWKFEPVKSLEIYYILKVFYILKGFAGKFQWGQIPYFWRVLVNLPFHMECQLYTPFDQYHCRNGGRLNIWLCDWISQQFHGIYQRRPTALRYWSNPHGNFESQFVIPRKIISIKNRVWNSWKIAKNQYSNLFTLTFFSNKKLFEQEYYFFSIAFTEKFWKI